MIDLDELLKLREAATSGPWEVEEVSHVINDTVWFSEIIKTGDDEKIVNQGAGKADAAYIVAACNAVPELVARIRELEAQRDWMAQAAANAGWYGVRVGKDYMIDQARIAVSRAQAEQHECPTPEVSCHARDGKLCMSNNHLACAQAVNKKSLKQISALEPCRIVSNNNSQPPEWLMRRFTEVK